MFHQPRSLIRCTAIGLAACAIAPAFASAQPIIAGQGVAAGGGPGVTAKQFQSQNLTAPDQVDRTSGPTANVYVPPTTTAVPATTNAPTWPTGPQPAATRHAPVHHATPAASPSTDGGGLDTAIWIALGGAALVAAGGIALAGRLRVTRKRQLA
jgi:hypothetical protein